MEEAPASLLPLAAPVQHGGEPPEVRVQRAVPGWRGLPTTPAELPVLVGHERGGEHLEGAALRHVGIHAALVDVRHQEGRPPGGVEHRHVLCEARWRYGARGGTFSRL